MSIASVERKNISLYVGRQKLSKTIRDIEFFFFKKNWHKLTTNIFWSCIVLHKVKLNVKNSVLAPLYRPIHLETTF